VRKGKKDVSYLPFIRLAKELLYKCPEWWELHPGSRDIYLLLKGKYNGVNNGQLRLYYSEIRKRKIRGLRSDKAISRAFRELESKGLVERTKIGGLYHYINEYRLTGKYDCLL
jgi:hypothetical protein